MHPVPTVSDRDAIFTPMLGVLTKPKTAVKLAVVSASLYSLLQWWIKRTRYGGLQGGCVLAQIE